MKARGRAAPGGEEEQRPRGRERRGRGARRDLGGLRRWLAKDRRWSARGQAASRPSAPGCGRCRGGLGRPARGRRGCLRIRGCHLDGAGLSRLAYLLGASGRGQAPVAADRRV